MRIKILDKGIYQRYN